MSFSKEMTDFLGAFKGVASTVSDLQWKQIQAAYYKSMMLKNLGINMNEVNTQFANDAPGRAAFFKNHGIDDPANDGGGFTGWLGGLFGVKQPLARGNTATVTQSGSGGSGGYTPIKAGEAAPMGGFDNAVNRTLGFEGTQNKVTIDNDGGRVKYGINSNSDKGVNLDTLTLDQAKQIYKDKYWNKIDGIEQMSPQMQHVAFDAAVNSGPAQANKWVQQSGGDPEKFQQLRQKFMDDLVASGRRNSDGSLRYPPNVASAWKDRMAALNGDLKAGKTSTTPGGTQTASTTPAAPAATTANTGSSPDDPKLQKLQAEADEADRKLDGDMTAANLDRVERAQTALKAYKAATAGNDAVDTNGFTAADRAQNTKDDAEADKDDVPEQQGPTAPIDASYGPQPEQAGPSQPAPPAATDVSDQPAPQGMPQPDMPGQTVQSMPIGSDQDLNQDNTQQDFGVWAATGGMVPDLPTEPGASTAPTTLPDGSPIAPDDDMPQAPGGNYMSAPTNTPSSPQPPGPPVTQGGMPIEDQPVASKGSLTQPVDPAEAARVIPPKVDALAAGAPTDQDIKKQTFRRALADGNDHAKVVNSIQLAKTMPLPQPDDSLPSPYGVGDEDNQKYGNNLPQILRGALLTMQKDGQYDAPGGALKSDGHAQGVKDLANNAGAMTDTDLYAGLKVADPNNQLTTGMGAVRVLEMRRQQAMQDGDMDKSNKFAVAMVQKLKELTQQLGAYAVHAGQQGDEDGMVRATAAAVDATPNGNSATGAKVGPNKYMITYRDPDGKIINQVEGSPQGIFNIAMGYARGNTFYHEIIQAAAKDDDDAASETELQARLEAAKAAKGAIPDGASSTTQTAQGTPPGNSPNPTGNTGPSAAAGATTSKATTPGPAAPAAPAGPELRTVKGFESLGPIPRSVAEKASDDDDDKPSEEEWDKAPKTVSPIPTPAPIPGAPAAPPAQTASTGQTPQGTGAAPAPIQGTPAPGQGMPDQGTPTAPAVDPNNVPDKKTGLTPQQTMEARARAQAIADRGPEPQPKPHVSTANDSDGNAYNKTQLQRIYKFNSDQDTLYKQEHAQWMESYRAALKQAAADDKQSAADKKADQIAQKAEQTAQEAEINKGRNHMDPTTAATNLSAIKDEITKHLLTVPNPETADSKFDTYGDVPDDPDKVKAAAKDLGTFIPDAQRSRVTSLANAILANNTNQSPQTAAAAAMKLMAANSDDPSAVKYKVLGVTRGGFAAVQDPDGNVYNMPKTVVDSALVKGQRFFYDLAVKTHAKQGEVDAADDEREDNNTQNNSDIQKSVQAFEDNHQAAPEIAAKPYDAMGASRLVGQGAVDYAARKAAALANARRNMPGSPIPNQ